MKSAEKDNAMKHGSQCPKCGSDRIWAIDKLARPVPGSLRDAEVIHVMAVRVERPPTALDRIVGNESPAELRIVGVFEARICAECGYTEWYANEVNDGLLELSQMEGTGVRLLSTASRGGPFR